MNFFISEAMAEAPAAAAGAQQAGWEGLIFPIGLVIILYFFMIRPQIKRQKEHKSLVESLKKGDEVQTMGGMMGKITDLGDNFCKVEISEGIEVKIRKASIEAVMPKGSLDEL
jgi:preprotein translocase subunit YajC